MIHLWTNSKSRSFKLPKNIIFIEILNGHRVDANRRCWGKPTKSLITGVVGSYERPTIIKWKPDKNRSIQNQLTRGILESAENIISVGEGSIQDWFLGALRIKQRAQ